MPPKESKKRLTAEHKDLLYKWIEQGADYDEHWAWQKPTKRETSEAFKTPD